MRLEYSVTFTEGTLLCKSYLTVFMHIKKKIPIFIQEFLPQNCNVFVSFVCYKNSDIFISQVFPAANTGILQWM